MTNIYTKRRFESYADPLFGLMIHYLRLFMTRLKLTCFKFQCYNSAK